MINHIIPCCVKSFKLSNDALINLVEASIEHATESERQRLIQRSMEDKLKATTGHGEKTQEIEEDDPMNTGAPVRGTPPAPAPTQTQTPASAVQQNEVIDADAIIDKFNVIRSGRSFNDSDIREAIKKFLGTMAPGQLKSFFGVLQQMGQIVQPNVAPRVQAPPQEPQATKDARLQALRAQHDTKNAQQANIQAPQPAPTQNATQPSKEDADEDTSPPIRVGKRTAEAIKRKMKASLYS